jgi:gamma-glutamylcyclotransferase (GGCT)/AIG2-like uncharacterized protein YtfP
MTKVFVYGSLLSGLGNHGLLEDATFLGKTKTPRGFAMLDLGWFPGVIHSDVHEAPVLGEVYEVDDDTLKRLDRLEGYRHEEPDSGLYNKATIETEFGEAIIYIYNNHYGRGNIVSDGDWRSYYSSKMRI